MTGYGKQTYTNKDYHIEVQIKSLNSRYFDFRTSLPNELQQFEMDIKKLLNSKISRGKVDIRIDFISSKETEMQINTQKINQLKKCYDKIIEMVGYQGNFPIEDILHQQNILIEKKEEDSSLKALLLQTIELALRKHQEMAEEEGRKMKLSTNESMQRISSSLTTIKKEFPVYRDKIYTDIKENVQKIVNERTEEMEKRILAEVAMYVEKADINEEIIRLQSHIEKINELTKKTNPIGKSFNFVLQEMHREINTIGNKFNSSKLFKDILTIKEEIEKCREMIQNVE